jgi:hypothetical protein
VAIPDSVTTIGGYAFGDCTSLTSVSIGNGVTTIGDYAFRYCTSLTSVTIPDSVTSIGNLAFYACNGLTSVTVGNGVTSIGFAAFRYCTSLTSVTIGNSVTSIGDSAFGDCISLTSVTIPNSVISIGDSAFRSCTNLQRVHFAGDAPTAALNSFSSSPATLYYRPGTIGWGATLAGRPTVLWNPRIVTDDGMFGVHAGHFGFTFMGAANVPVAIEACSDLGNPSWTTITNLTCGADGTVQFTDPEAADQPVRIYRFRPE